MSLCDYLNEDIGSANMVNFKTKKYNNVILHHGSDGKPIVKFDKASFFFIDSPEIASTYGLDVYECSGTFDNVLQFVEGDDLERNGPNGFLISGTSQTVRKLIMELMKGATAEQIEESLAHYKRFGIGQYSPARTFNDRWDIVESNLKRLGYVAMEIRDETMMGSNGGTYPALFVVEPEKIKIDKVYVYDNYYGEPEETYSFEQWKNKHLNTRKVKV